MVLFFDTADDDEMIYLYHGGRYIRKEGYHIYYEKKYEICGVSDRLSQEEGSSCLQRKTGDETSPAASWRREGRRQPVGQGSLRMPGKDFRHLGRSRISKAAFGGGDAEKSGKPGTEKKFCENLRGGESGRYYFSDSAGKPGRKEKTREDAIGRQWHLAGRQAGRSRYPVTGIFSADKGASSHESGKPGRWRPGLRWCWSFWERLYPETICRWRIWRTR